MAKKTSSLPDVRIKHGWLLEITTYRLWELTPKPRPPYPSEAQVQKRLREYRATWDVHGDRLLEALCQRFNLRFRQSEIEMFIVRNALPIASPLTIDTRRAPQHFLDLACHELLHRLFANNTLGLAPRKIFPKMFPGEAHNVQGHVLVHAGLQYLYEEVWKQPSRTHRDINIARARQTRRIRPTPDYARSWQIVEKRGYRELIAEFKSHY